MTDLRELYQQVILDHNRNPRNFRALEGAHREADGHNPLCGDEVTVYVHLEGDVIADISFQGQGCAISKASCSLMTEALKGKTVQHFRALFREFHDLVTAKPGEAAPPKEKLGKLAVLGGVSEFPMRVKCATLAWHTLQAALDKSEEPVTTE